MSGGRWQSRADRLAEFAQFRMHDGHDPAPPGHVTASQAAARLGVSKRTIERYKQELRSTGYPHPVDKS